MSDQKPTIGRPRVPRERQLTRPVRFTPSTERIFNDLGLTLADGVRLAIHEYFQRQGVDHAIQR